MESAGIQRSSKSIFPDLFAAPRFVVPAADGHPELGLRVKSGEGFEGTPSATLEWKSFDEAGIEELLQASTGALQDSFFREKGQSWKFYAQPPYGLGTLYAGPSAIAVFCYEMVGRLIFSLYDSGYSLGTEKHKRVYDCIEKHIENDDRKKIALDLSDHVVNFEVCESVGNRVRFTRESVNGNFYKILRHDRFKIAGPKPWRDLYHVYNKLGEVQDLPASLVPAQLFYGEYQVAICMPFCVGATSCPQHLSLAQKDDLMAALTALGKAGLCYTDFRPPNLLVTPDGSLRVVDYDDVALFEDEQQVKENYSRLGPIMFDGTTKWDDVDAIVREYAAGN